MNQPTLNLISILQNVKHKKPAFHSFINNENGSHIKFVSKTSKVTSTIMDTFLYTISEEDYKQLDWKVINNKLSYLVNDSYPIDPFISIA